MTRIVRVLAPNPGPFTLEGTNTWIVGRDPSIVIDPGPTDASHLLAVLDEAAPVAAVIVTHRHDDHAQGAARFAEAAGADLYAFRPVQGEQALVDGGILRAGGEVEIRVVHTPGHTSDHVALWMPSVRALFTGDAVLGRGTSVVDPPEGDMTAYIRSLERMRALEPRTIYPGHGPAVFDAVFKIEEYLDHRAEREGQVLAALEAGAATPDEIVPGIYGEEIPQAMFPVAARSVLAHLVKLEREGKAARAGTPGEAKFRASTPKPCKRCGKPAMPGSRFCGRCAVAALQEGP